MIKELYGKSIKVRLETSETGASVTRHVTEDLSRVDLQGEGGADLEVDDPNEQSCMMYSQAAMSQAGDGLEDDENAGPAKEFSHEALNNHDLKIIFMQLRNLQKEFKKSKEEICELFCRVSGVVERIRWYLDPTHEKHDKVITWSPLEDMALTEPDTSVEFQVLLQEKGWVEISDRRHFLKVRPVFECEVAKDQDNQFNQVAGAAATTSASI